MCPGRLQPLAGGRQVGRHPLARPPARQTAGVSVERAGDRRPRHQPDPRRAGLGQGCDRYSRGDHCHTTKGKGVSFMLDRHEWHGKAPNREQAIAALAELGEEPGEKSLELARTALVASFPARRARDGRCATLSAPSWSTWANEIPNLVVLDADISSSLKTGAFRQAYPRPSHQLRRGRAGHAARRGRAGDGGVDPAGLHLCDLCDPARLRADSQLHLLWPVERQGDLLARWAGGGLGRSRRTRAPRTWRSCARCRT